MFKMDSNQIMELCNFAYVADKEARSDLIGGYIATENDYTSNFTGALRRIINANSKTKLSATSYVLSPADERLSGCDATIILTSNNYFKVITFEAKYPRMSKKYYNWDYSQTSTGLSHFSDQLERQKRFSSIHAIFEMFYCDLPYSKQPVYMQNYVSSCVWHKDAISFDSKRKNTNQVWSSTDLENLLKIGNLSIDKILHEVCICSQGKPTKCFGKITDMAQEFSLFGNVLHIAASDSESDDFKN